MGLTGVWEIAFRQPISKLKKSTIMNKKQTADSSAQNDSKPLVVGSFLTTTLLYRKYMFMYGVLSVLHV